MDKKNPIHSYINVKDGKNVTMDGVVNILRFDEKNVSLEYDAGKIEIEGDGLKIESLSREDGVIIVNGKIEGVFYYKEQISRGFFKKIFG